MELELGRHAWSSLQGTGGDAASLPRAIADLVQARDRVSAESAFQRIERVVFANGILSEVSPALASALVHGLWYRNVNSEDLILGLLADIAGGFVDESDPDVHGVVSVAECLREVCRAYSAYVEILETGNNANSRTACIDLILMCGLADDHLRSRSIFFLSEAVKRSDLQGYRAVIESSLNELSGQSGCS